MATILSTDISLCFAYASTTNFNSISSVFLSNAAYSNYIFSILALLTAISLSAIIIIILIIQIRNYSKKLWFANKRIKEQSSEISILFHAIEKNPSLKSTITIVYDKLGIPVKSFNTSLISPLLHGFISPETNLFKTRLFSTEQINQIVHLSQLSDIKDSSDTNTLFNHNKTNSREIYKTSVSTILDHNTKEIKWYILNIQNITEEQLFKEKSNIYKSVCNAFVINKFDAYTLYYESNSDAFCIFKNNKLENTEMDYKIFEDSIPPLERPIFNEAFLPVCNGELSHNSINIHLFNTGHKQYMPYCIYMESIRNSVEQPIGVSLFLIISKSSQRNKKVIDSLKLKLDLTVQAGNYVIWKYYPTTKTFKYYLRNDIIQTQKLDNILLYVHPEDHNKLINILTSTDNKVESDNIFVVRIYSTKTKKYKCYENTIRYMQGDGIHRNYLIGTSKDITSTILKYRELDEYRINMDTLCNNANIAIIEYYTETHHIEVIHSSFEDSLGVNAENFHNYVMEDSAQNLASLEDYLNSQNNKEFRTTIKLLSPVQNAPVYLDFFFFPVYNYNNNCIEKYVGHIRNTSKLIESQRAALEHINHDSIILSNLPFEVGLLSEDYTLLWKNTSQFSEFGFLKDLNIGEHCYKSYKHNNAPCKDCPLSKLNLSSDKLTFIKVRDNRSYQITGLHIKNEVESLSGYILKIEDITSSVNLKAQMENAKIQYSNIDKERAVILKAVYESICVPLLSNNNDMAITKTTKKIALLYSLYAMTYKLNTNDFNFLVLFNNTILSNRIQGFHFICTNLPQELHIIFDKGLLHNILTLICEEIISISTDKDITTSYSYIKGQLNIFFYFTAPSEQTNNEYFNIPSSNLNRCVLNKAISYCNGTFTGTVNNKHRFEIKISIPCELK